MSTSPRVQPNITKFARIALVAGIGASIGCAATAYLDPERFFPAYLVSFLFWIGLSLGSLAIHMLHHVTGGSWGVAIRRILESAASTAPLMALLFLPIAFGMTHLYEWSHADVVAQDEILQRKTRYLNVESFYLRAALYFAIWIAWSWLLNLGSRTPDAAVQKRRQNRLARFSSVGLVLWGLTVTFASVDWSMSLEPHWFSSMYGVLFIAGQAVSALSFAIIVAVILRGYFGTTNVLTTPRLHDLGNLLLAFVMFWSYVSFMQFLIIWSGNLPEENPWYLRRSYGGWQVFVVLLMSVHFLLPFLLLLMRQTKRHGTRLASLALLLLAMRVVDLTWQVVPTFTSRLLPGFAAAPPEVSHAAAGDTSSSLIDLWPLLLTIPAIGGLWIAFAAWRLAVRGPIPVHEFHPIEEAGHAVVGHAH